MQKLIIISIVFMTLSNLSLITMDTPVEQQIKKLRQDSAKKQERHWEKCDDCRGGFPCDYSRLLSLGLIAEVAKTILDVGDLIDDKEKINYVSDDHFYPVRKEIIKRMISEGIHPNNIKYQHTITPLYESVLFNDSEFAKFLIQQGATPDERTRKSATPEFLVNLLETNK